MNIAQILVEIPDLLQLRLTTHSSSNLTSIKRHLYVRKITEENCWTKAKKGITWKIIWHSFSWTHHSSRWNLSPHLYSIFSSWTRSHLPSPPTNCPQLFITPTPKYWPIYRSKVAEAIAAFNTGLLLTRLHCGEDKRIPPSLSCLFNRHHTLQLPKLFLHYPEMNESNHSRD